MSKDSQEIKNIVEGCCKLNKYKMGKELEKKIGSYTTKEILSSAEQYCNEKCGVSNLTPMKCINCYVWEAKNKALKFNPSKR